jgi:hypothetical protein
MKTDFFQQIQEGQQIDLLNRKSQSAGLPESAGNPMRNRV